MKLTFDPNQEYQKKAVDAVISLFKGQSIVSSDFELSSKTGSLSFSEKGVANKLSVTYKDVLENLQEVQLNYLKPSQGDYFKLDDQLYFLKYMNGREEYPEEISTPIYNFTVEMETGTGKTYVYLRTIFELNRVYGYKKFVIVVPSVAIREGVYKSLQITEDHLKSLYNNTPYNYYLYESAKVSQLRNFAVSNTIQILVINIDSFTKDINVINNPNDRLSGLKPIEFIQNTNPIVIMDEPQNMETDIRKKGIHNLNPLFTLRYSATHKYLYNLIYSLNPVTAYDEGLVKHIEVDSIYSKDEFNNAYVNLISASSTRTRTSAKIEIFVNQENTADKKKISVKNGDDLYEKSNQREIYKNGYIVNEIDITNQSIKFANGLMVSKGFPLGAYTDEIMKYQLEQTIEEHLKKELKLKPKGIKVLSLFFIDKVANYREYDDEGNPLKGKFAKWFEEIYQKYSTNNNFSTLDLPASHLVHNGYFSQDRNGRLKDSSENRETVADFDTYSLIMKEKERLLEFNEPLRFIFSHSALREGWDNPNVFQICTLNETQSKMKKRQEIGRGMRLPVNQSGERVFDRDINRLTVVANESYDDFAKNLQKELEDDCNVKFEGRIKNKRDRITISYKKGFQLDERFKEIWERIKYKTNYRVNYETTSLIEKASKKIKEMPAIRKPTLYAEKRLVEFGKEGIEQNLTGISTKIVEDDIFVIPDILGYIQNRIHITRSTIAEILKSSNRLKDVFINPQLFLENITRIIQETLNEFLIDGIEYHKIGDKYYDMLLFQETTAYKDSLIYELKNNSNTIHEKYIPLDSVSVEYKFAEDCEKNENIEMYFKLPYWFKINTPLGSYNPDWAIIYKNSQKIYFVAETKDVEQKDTIDRLRPDEQGKIKCARVHFKEFADVNYHVVKDHLQLSEIVNIVENSGK